MIGVDFWLNFRDPRYFQDLSDRLEFSFECHKFMLAGRSKVFHEMFKAKHGMQSFKIESEDLTREAIFNMMKFIYTGTVNEVPTSTKSAVAHLNLANSYDLLDLGKLVLEKLRKSLKVSTCFEILAPSTQSPVITELKELAKQVIVENLSNLSQEEMGSLSRTQHTAMILRRYFDETDRESKAAQEDDEDSAERSSIIKLSTDLQKSLNIEISCRSGSSTDCELTLILDTLKRGNDGNIILGADFTINVQGKGIHCHKFMLAARSQVFHDMFKADPKLDSYEMGHHFTTAVKNMISFIYSGILKTSDIPIETVPDHLRLATTYNLEPMRQLVEQKLIDCISASNAIKLLNLALDEPSLIHLKERALDCVVNNLSTVTRLEEWENFTSDQPDMTKKILCTYFMSS